MFIVSNENGEFIGAEIELSETPMFFSELDEVEEAILLMHEGEWFVHDMNAPFKVFTLAKNLVEIQ